MNNAFFTDKQVLVTGASGFIGRNLCMKLKDLGAKIYGITTRKQKKSDTVDEWLVGDLVNLEFARSAVAKSKPDIMFHLAGFASGRRDLGAVQPAFHNNLTSTVNILTVTTEIGIQRLILAGSMEEPENDEIVPVSPYAASKWATTIYARMFYQLYGTPVTIPRIFMVYGPGDRNFKRLIPYVILSLIHQKKPELTSGKRLIDWIYIDDLVRGLIKMASAEGIEGKTIGLGSGKQLSIQEICKRIEAIIKSDIQIEFGAIAERVFERVCVADIRMASQYLDWKPEVNINMGLKQTVKWYINEIRQNSLTDCFTE